MTVSDAPSGSGASRWLGSGSDSGSSSRSYRDVPSSTSPPRRAPSGPPAPPLPPAAADRVPAQARLGPRSEVHRVRGGAQVDADGFQRPRRRHRQRRPRRDHAHPATTRPRSPTPKEEEGLCFRCLSPHHRVRDCTGDVRCRICFVSGHESRHCEQRHLNGAGTPPHGHAQTAMVSLAAPAPRPATPPPPPPAPATTQARPAVDPQDPVRVIVSRSVEVEQAEEVLRRAMVASITGTRPPFTAEEVTATIYEQFKLRPGDFSVHLHQPEDFLLIFRSQELKDRLSGDHFIGGAGYGFTLSLRPWCKLAHAGLGSFDFKVELELHGIPAQAWNLSTAERLLNSSCWIERLHPSTRTRADMATYRLDARTCDPASIHRRAILEVIEVTPARHPSQAPSIKRLTYPVSIDIVRYEADRAPPLMPRTAATLVAAAVVMMANLARAVMGSSMVLRSAALRGDAAGSDAAPTPPPPEAVRTAWPWMRSRGLSLVTASALMGCMSTTRGAPPPVSAATCSCNRAAPALTGPWCHGHDAMEPAVLVAVPKEESLFGAKRKGKAAAWTPALQAQRL
ncbi:hypothetical protein ACQ4PT_047365 [Festuca glaucescens]